MITPVGKDLDLTTDLKSKVNRIELDFRINLYILTDCKGIDYDRLCDNLEQLVKNLDEFDLDRTHDILLADLLIILAKNKDWGARKVLNIRGELQHFLKPILLISDQVIEECEPFIDQHIVLPVKQVILESAVKNLLRVSRKIQDLVAVPDEKREKDQRQIQTLRFLYARDPFTFSPMRDYQSQVGYKFPLIQKFFNVSPGEEVAFLEELEEMQLLTTKLLDKVNICPFCNHTQLNFREICPQCNSLNISEETAIHHFRCAYIGKESEFRDDLNLRCPKCSHELRHIGVDYDKPSEVLWCHDCKYNFSEPVLSCSCLFCANSFPPEDTLIKRINEYELSQIGIRAAEEGTLPSTGLINILKKELGFYKREIFMEMLKIERSRCKRYKINSTLSRFSLKSADEALSQPGVSLSRKFKNDFATVINQTFRNTDLFTDTNEGDILGIFTHTNYDNAKIAFNRLSESINQVSTKRIDLKYQLYDLTSEEDNINLCMADSS